MADEFPLPGSSYKELIKIIQGYGKYGKEASLGHISQLTAIGETVVSANNKFLVATGVIKGGEEEGDHPARSRTRQRARTQHGRRNLPEMASDHQQYGFFTESRRRSSYSKRHGRVESGIARRILGRSA